MHDAVVVDDDYDEDGGHGGDGADDDAPPDHQHRRDIVAAAAGDRLFVQLPIIAQHRRYDDEVSHRVNVYIYGGNAQLWVRPPPLPWKYQHLMLYAPEAVPAQVRW